MDARRCSEDTKHNSLHKYKLETLATYIFINYTHKNMNKTTRGSNTCLFNETAVLGSVLYQLILYFFAYNL